MGLSPLSLPPNAIDLTSIYDHLHLPLNHPLTFPSLLSGAARFHSPSIARQLHAFALKSTTLHNTHIINSLIHLYSSSHLLNSALNLFEKMPQPLRDVVTYTTLISASVNANQPILALQLFHSMHTISPNEATIVSVLRACADLGALTSGRFVHSVATQQGIAWKSNVVTALVDMYTKCGRIHLAERVFDRVVDKDLFLWTVMIGGLASHGDSGKALGLFRRMVESGLDPDERTITAALSACRNSGWVDVGYRIFNSIGKFGMIPEIQHYGCMVDLLARTGRLEEAEMFIRRMPIEPDSVLWRNLIWASKFHGDIERAKRLIEETQHIELDSGSGDGYTLKGNVYAYDKQWQEKARMRELMEKRRTDKLPGCSRIEINGVVHEFVVGDSRHLEREQIYCKLEEVAERLKMEGYKPRVSEVLLEMEDEEKECQLNHHSEKLAMAFGLIKRRREEEIVIVKNLRACEDCHNVMKLVSKVYRRKIIVRDRIKFHHFSNGSCSCGDFW